jgi:hypothetical protein
MPFVRLLLLVVAVLAAVVVGFAVFRPDPDAAPSAQTMETPQITQPTRTVAAPPPRSIPSQVTSPGDASSPAEITAQEAAEAVRRLAREQQENTMMVPDERPADLTSSW